MGASKGVVCHPAQVTPEDGEWRAQSGIKWTGSSPPAPGAALHIAGAFRMRQPDWGVNDEHTHAHAERLLLFLYLSELATRATSLQPTEMAFGVTRGGRLSVPGLKYKHTRGAELFHMVECSKRLQEDEED